MAKEHLLYLQNSCEATTTLLLLLVLSTSIVGATKIASNINVYISRLYYNCYLPSLA